MRLLYWTMILLGAAAILIGVVQTAATLAGGNGVWLHLELGGPGSAIGGIILGAMGWFLLEDGKVRSKK